MNIFLARLLPAAAIFLCAGVSSIAEAQDWPHWRGPNWNGAAEAKNLPTEWSQTENVKWKTPMPGASGATPIILGDKVFVSSLDNRTQDLVGMCLDRNTGKILWQKPLAIGFNDEGRGRNMASPSPVTDGKHVYFMFGTRELFCLDLDGNQIWKRNLEEDLGTVIMNFGVHTTPTLYKGKLYVALLHRNRPDNVPNTPDGVAHSYLLAFDPETGDYLFKSRRENEAHDESQEAYTIPIPWEREGRDEILLIAGDCISGHDPETGKEYWRWGEWNPKKIGHWRMVPSAVTYGDLVYVCAPKQGPVYAIKAGGEGTLGEEWVEWESPKRGATSDVCIPLVYKDRLYIFNGDRRKNLHCVNPKTGEVYWEGEVGGDAVFRASMLGSDDTLYVINEEGHIAVLGTGDKFEILNRIEFADEGLCRSTIVASDGNLFIRTGENLYCIGE